MERLAEDGGKRWLLAGGSAVIAAVLILPLFRMPPVPPTAAPSAVRSSVLLRPLQGTDVAFDEKTMLTDPSPQFLPTRWNAAQKELAGPEPGAGFESYGPKLSAASAETELKLSLPMPFAVPATAVDALLADPPGSMLRGFGQTATVLPALPARGAFAEIFAAGTGRPVLRQALTDAKPPGDGTWQPVEFSVAIDATGLVSGVSVTRRSDVEGVDQYFQRYLAQTLRIGQRLAPGFYRISVGP